MASLWALPSSLLFFNNSISNRNIVACRKRLSIPRSNLKDETTTEITMRRSANYPPSLWSYDFIQSLSSEYTKEMYLERSRTLKEAVRAMIYKTKEMEENPLSILNLIDDLQRLGISYNFVNEISNVLENIYCIYYKSHEEWTKMDLNLKSLGFRLLRQHGYHIPQEIFKDVIDVNGILKGHLYEDIIGVLNLYEASYHSVEDESILDDVRIFSQRYLKDSIENIADKNIVSVIRHALDFPLHWMLPRVETKWFIEVYERRRDRNPMVLEFAKLDFNMVQAIYQEDLKYASRWWKETRWENFGFARDRLVENFMWSVTENYLPHFKGRRDLTKVNAMITTIDDVYDVYGTVQELEIFTDVVNSWDLNAVKELPDYMKICFLALYNAINEMSYKVLTNDGVFILPYFKRAWQDLCNSYIIEARWFNSGYTPTLNEFLNNGYMSIGILPIIKHAYVLMLTNVSEDTLKQIERAENMIRNACIIVRLTNDMGTSSDELERGDVPKSIQCYMHESDATEVEAREYIKELTVETWKKLNKERQSIGSDLPHEFIECVTNLARMGHFMYTGGDKHGKPDMFKPYALSLFVNPILLP
uniref:Putative monoterpene synthase n=1 Tax=Xanthium strumarium TaxID=318068 RepID=A0A142BX72_XANST|nr:putative monoterpene synthase [Xanthium strumarium]